MTEIDLPASVWIFPILGHIPNNPTATQKAKGDVRKILEVLNNHLLTRTFLVGERISLADIVVSMSVYRLYTRVRSIISFAYLQVLDPNFRKSFQNVNRWFTTMVNQPEFLAVIGETKLCEKMEVAPEPSKEEKKEEKPKKEAKPKKEEKKEEKPKKEAKKDDAEEPEEENYGEEKPKGKNPLDLLPPS